MRASVAKIFRDMPPNPSMVIPFQASLVAERANGCVGAANLSLPTFTRATVAYQTDFEGKQNLVPSGAARMQGARFVYNRINALSANPVNWASATVTITTGVSDPLGGTAAWTLTALAGVFKEKYWSQVTGQTIVSGESYLGAMFLRRRTGVGTVSVFNLGDSNTLTDITAQLTTSWKRFATPVVAVTNNSNRLGVRFGTEGDAVDFYLPTIEIVTGQINQNPSEPVSVGVLAAPYHGAGVDGVKYFPTLNGNTVASNVVTEATGAAINSSEAACAGGVTAGVVDASGPKGLLTIPSEANVLGTTAAIVRTMADAGWVNGGTVTVGSATGADGVASAGASLTFGAVEATNTLLFTTVLGAAVRSYVPLVRRKTGTGVVSITVDNGVTWTPMTLTTAYQPIKEVTASAANPVVGFKGATNLDAIEVDFNMLVAGSIAPPVPVPLNVTTAAAVLGYVSAGNISAAATSITINLTPTTDLGSTTVFHWASYVDASNYTAILSDGTNLIARKRIAATNHDATVAWARAAGTTAKIGARFDIANGVDVFLDGVRGTADATTTASQIGANFQIGADGNGANQDYCEHRFFNVYPTALSAARLQAMTA